MVKVGDYVRCVDKFGETFIGRVMIVREDIDPPKALVAWVDSGGDAATDYYVFTDMHPVTATISKPDIRKPIKS